jgi:hypothetical protein
VAKYDTIRALVAEYRTALEERVLVERIRV